MATLAAREAEHAQRLAALAAEKDAAHSLAMQQAVAAKAEEFETALGTLRAEQAALEAELEKIKASVAELEKIKASVGSLDE